MINTKVHWILSAPSQLSNNKRLSNKRRQYSLSALMGGIKHRKARLKQRRGTAMSDANHDFFRHSHKSGSSLAPLCLVSATFVPNPVSSAMRTCTLRAWQIIIDKARAFQTS